MKICIINELVLLGWFSCPTRPLRNKFFLLGWGSVWAIITRFFRRSLVKSWSPLRFFWHFFFFRIIFHLRLRWLTNWLLTPKTIV